jgi:excisionase family DNA binding protein
MEDNQKIVEAEVPKQGFFHVHEAAEVTGFSKDFISKQIREGRLRVLQVSAGTPGSRLRIPRGELVRWLAGMIR